MKTWVVGVNWWMTDYMRLMFQYSQSDLGGYPDHAVLRVPYNCGAKGAALTAPRSEASACAPRLTGKTGKAEL